MSNPAAGTSTSVPAALAPASSSPLGAADLRALRDAVSGQVLVDGFTALAMIIDASPFGRMMGNVYLRVARPGIPTRLFTDPEPARAWLIAYRQ